MKRTVCLALAMSMVMGTTAFAAERNPIVLVNRQEFFLQDTAMQKDGKWLFSAEDLAEMTGSQMTNLGESLLFTTKTVAEDAERQMERTVVLRADGTLDVTAREKDRLYLGDKINRENGKCFLPVREFVNEMGYTMTWDRFLGSDWIYLKELRTPDVTLTVEYDKKTNNLQGTINNKEPQSFLYGNAFTLERLGMRGKGRTKDGDRDFDAANQKRDRRKRHDHNREKNKRGTCGRRIPHGDSIFLHLLLRGVSSIGG